MSEPFGSPKASGKESRMVRKRGFEPLRYCYRQRLKLVEIACSRELKRILRTDVAQERAQPNACADSIRANPPLMSIHPMP